MLRAEFTKHSALRIALCDPLNAVPRGRVAGGAVALQADQHLLEFVEV